MKIHPDSKVHGANMGPIWVLLDPDGPHIGPLNLAIRADIRVLVICWAADPGTWLRIFIASTSSAEYAVHL